MFFRKDPQPINLRFTVDIVIPVFIELAPVGDSQAQLEEIVDAEVVELPRLGSGSSGER